ncbi:MAG TPA: hypothetical protein VEY07_04535 [Thermoplasmata archaeon]|nr:hypothetical protein [Thermoplasmata archaeon]
MTDLHVAVIFDSRHGTTTQVAQALVEGLHRVPGIVAELDFVPDVRSDVIERSDLLIVGGPTEFFSASHHMRVFFNLMGAYDLHGKYAFAFDTHAGGALSGSAARFIERRLKLQGVTLLEPRASAIVEARPGGASRSGLQLTGGTAARFVEIGAKLGAELQDAIRARRAQLGDTGATSPVSP